MKAPLGMTQILQAKKSLLFVSLRARRRFLSSARKLA
jgi:hypothetical protein